jgi:hypothetical protein
MKNKVSPSV